MRLIQGHDSLVTAPTALPMSVEWAKAHIKALSNSEDLLIESWIKAATEYFEEQTGRQIMLATWEYWLDAAFPSDPRIELPHPPLREVLAVEYVGSAGAVVSFTNGASPEVVSWQTRAPTGVYASRGWVETKYGLVWPTARDESGAVRIRYTAGYAETEADVPELIKGALCRLVASYDQFRSDVHLSDRGSSLDKVPGGVDQMLFAFKYSAMPSQVLRRL